MYSICSTHAHEERFGNIMNGRDHLPSKEGDLMRLGSPMRTSKNCGRSDRSRLRYPSHLRDWARVHPLISGKARRRFFALRFQAESVCTTPKRT